MVATARERIDKLSPAQRVLLKERLDGVVTRARSSGGTLVAHVLVESGDAVDAARIREFLSDRLPKAMIPSAILVAAEWPRTPAGKLDIAALRSRAAGAVERPRAFTPASNDAEQTISRIWEELLGVARVSVDENFFELGGHSLLLARVRVRLRQAFGVDLPMVELFRYLTVRSLARALTSAAPSGPAGMADPEEIRGRARKQRAAWQARAGRESKETD